MTLIRPPEPTLERTEGGRWRWLSAEEWDRIALGSPCATPFHARWWAEAICAHGDPSPGRFEPRALGLSLSDGTQALVPLCVRRGRLRRGLLGRAVSTRPGVYGGPLIEDRALSARDWEEALASLREAPLGRIDCYGNVWDSPPGELAAALPRSERATHWIDLTALPESPRGGYSKGCKHALTKAERAGVRVERLREAAEVGEYHAVYADSLRRWGKDPAQGYTAALFQDLLGRPGAELWCARMPSGELAAVGTFLWTARHCVWWHGSMRAAFAEAAPTNALIHGLVLEARARGVRRFDFNPSGGHAGVESFKRSFGAERATFLVWRHVHPLLARFAGRSLRPEDGA